MVSHLFQMLVHPLCEGLLLYGIPFIWGEKRISWRRMMIWVRIGGEDGRTWKPRKLLTDVNAGRPLNRSGSRHFVTDLASFKREPHWQPHTKAQLPGQKEGMCCLQTKVQNICIPGIAQIWEVTLKIHSTFNLCSAWWEGVMVEGLQTLHHHDKVQLR